MSKLVQFTDVHFPDPNPKFYDNLNNVKLDLINVSTRSSVNFVHISLQIRVVTSFFQVFCSLFFKGNSPGDLQNGIFCRLAGLFIFLASHLPSTHCDFSHIFKILPNVRSTINGKKADKNL